MNSFLDMTQIANFDPVSTPIEYSMLFQEISYPEYLSPECVSFIGQLLNVNDKDRLGYGPDGFEDIKNHDFFRGIDWDLLEQKQLKPPYIPPASLTSKDIFVDFQTIMRDLNNTEWLENLPHPRDNDAFSNWLFYFFFLLFFYFISTLYSDSFI